MWIPGHAAVGWLMARGAGLERRDRALVAWCAVLPDLDGLAILAGTSAYIRCHHVVLHNLLTAALLPALLCVFARRRLAVLALGAGAILLHFLSDGFGFLALSPLWPFDPSSFWPNGGRYWVGVVGEVVVPALLLWWQARIFRREGVSILEMISPSLDGRLANRLAGRGWGRGSP